MPRRNRKGARISAVSRREALLMKPCGGDGVWRRTDFVPIRSSHQAIRSSYGRKQRRQFARRPWYSSWRGMSSPATKSGLRPTQRRILRLVASFEFFKGIFVLLIGLSAILLVHKDAWVLAESLLALLHISTDRHTAQMFLNFADTSQTPGCGPRRSTRGSLPCCALPKPTDCGGSGSGRSGWRSAGVPC